MTDNIINSASTHNVNLTTADKKLELRNLIIISMTTTDDVIGLN